MYKTFDKNEKNKKSQIWIFNPSWALVQNELLGPNKI